LLFKENGGLLALSSEINMKTRQFFNSFDRAAKKTLSDLGESVQDAVIYHIGKVEGMNSSDVLKDPLKFAEALEKIFLSGATVLEDKIIGSMCKDLGVPLLEDGGNFEQKIAILYNLAFSKKIGSIKRESEKNSPPTPLESVSWQAL
jgi:hypothetical protein